MMLCAPLNNGRARAKTKKPRTPRAARTYRWSGSCSARRSSRCRCRKSSPVTHTKRLDMRKFRKLVVVEPSPITTKSLSKLQLLFSLYLCTRKSKGRDIPESRPFAEDVHATCCGFCLAAPPRSAAAHVFTNIIRVYFVKIAKLPIWTHLGRSTPGQRQRTGRRRGKVASAFRPGAASILDLRIGRLCSGGGEARLERVVRRR